MIQKHPHKLRRHRLKSGNVIYFCMLPDCSFKSSPALVLGKRAICHRCEQEFVMNEYSIRLAKPHCDACQKPKHSRPDQDPVNVFGVTESVSSLRDKLSLVLKSAEEEGDI
jgi:hypothetical protein